MVSDVILPHINVRKFTEIARASRPNLKVLFVTEYADNAILRGDLLDPGMDMLTKPFALDALGAQGTHDDRAISRSSDEQVATIGFRTSN
jgi:two-component SAPR family response regulator